MNYSQFQQSANKWMEFLFGSKGEFEDYLTRAKKNERIAKAFVFYTMTDESLFFKFISLAETDDFVKRNLVDLYYALTYAQSDPNYKYAKNIAALLLETFFNSTVRNMIDGENPTMYAHEYAKYINGFVTEMILELSDPSEEQRRYVEERLKQYMENRDL